MAISGAASPTGSIFPAGTSSNTLNPPQAARVLREHLALCRELLSLIQRENRALQSPDPFEAKEFADARKSLLPALSQAYKDIKEVGSIWQKLDSVERQSYVEICSLIRQNQDVIMNVVLLDRENERLMLRRGLVPEAQPSAEVRPRPHFVANLYRVYGKPL